MAKHRRGRIPGYTPEPELADELGLKEGTLRRWRRQGRVPAYIVVARRIHYCDDDKSRWLKSLRVVPPRSAHAA